MLQGQAAQQVLEVQLVQLVLVLSFQDQLVHKDQLDHFLKAQLVL
jgi:hypothetical protein